MDNAFQMINEVLFFKKEQTPNEDDLKLFAPFLINRYASMYSPELCEYINFMLNENNKTNLTPMELYKLFHTIIPKLKYKKITYIKKVTKDNNVLTKKEQELQDKIKCIAYNKELSITETNKLIEFAKEIYNDDRRK